MVNADLPVPEELDDRMTPASLDALAARLSVRWPAWYPPFDLTLAAVANESRPFWLIGGFLFASPRRAYAETVSFRARKTFFSGAPSIMDAGPGWAGRPLPDRYVVVGRTGEGPVIVDTSVDLPLLLWLDNEGCWRQPLIDFAAEGKSPAEVALAIAKRVKANG